MTQGKSFLPERCFAPSRDYFIAKAVSGGSDFALSACPYGPWRLPKGLRKASFKSCNKQPVR